MNIFLLNSNKIQLLLAEELKHYLQLSDSECIVICRKTDSDGLRTGIKNINTFSEFGKWKEVYLVKQFKINGFVGYLLNFIYFTFKVKRILGNNKLDNLIIGNYANEPMRHIANKYGNTNKVFVLDEGTSTIPIVVDRRAKLNRKGFASIVKKKILKFECQHIKHNICFFTTFKFEETFDTKRLQNNFILLKERLNTKSIVNKAVFIGAPLVEAGLITIEMHLALLKATKPYLMKEVEYIAHPKEDKANLDKIVSSVGMKVIVLDQPIELYLVECEQLPIQIASFYSTGFTNLYVLQSRKLKFFSFYLPSDILLKDTRKVDEVYRQLEVYSNNNKNFKLINLNYII